jgi:hypothetical protein
MEEIPLPTSRCPCHDCVTIVPGTLVVRKLLLPNSRRPSNCGITNECIWYGLATILNLEDGIIA